MKIDDASIVVVAGVLVTYLLPALFGITIQRPPCWRFAGMIVTLDAFGPVTDDAGGMAEIVQLAGRGKCASGPTRSTRSATPPA